MLLFLASAISTIAEDASQTPKLLLNTQRLRRLKRDRDRKTTRWLNFENRVNTVTDSEERGFELALYYAITGDESKGREAVTWALSHHSARQAALVADWCAALVSADQKQRLASINGKSYRDLWFQGIAGGTAKPVLPGGDFVWHELTDLAGGDYGNAEALYNVCETIYVVRAFTHSDLRDLDRHFFSILPSLLLLSAKPGEVNSPPWKMHVAALALVAVDPNLPASQFLQSWALEDGQTIREGPGVAYELLWADPYLPGIGYQNMDTWIYDDRGRLFARSGWETNSCWIEISAQGVQQENCPPNWEAETVSFGRLTLVPMTGRCVEIPHVANNESVLVWKLKPGQKVAHGKGKEQYTGEADSTGIWRPGAGVEGKACLAAH